ncbi:MAG: alpha/beta-type small acid-soluble spore protein [Clostridiales bacterium]|nr:alpha/beta-type small acid-soluble spore protein [Clostridiales bacterium]
MPKQGSLIPESKKKLDSWKAEAASSLNVNLQKGGDISAKDAGKVGGEMVKRMIEFAKTNMDK